MSLLKFQIVQEIIPGVTYDNGFHVNGHVEPYYSFAKPLHETHGWSDEMTYESKDTAKNHYFDVYNRKLVLEALRPALSQPNRSYIDVGCSSGFLLEDVLNTFPKPAVFGADYFPEGLVYIHSRSPQIPLFQIDLVSPAFTQDKFDAISCLNVLEHVESDVSALKHLHTILKPGGLLALTVPMNPDLFDLFDEAHYHVRRYRWKEFVDKVKGAGFKILQSNHFGFFIYPAFYLAKRRNQKKFSHLSLEEKRIHTFNQIRFSQSSRLLSGICAVEGVLGKIIPYPFGIRGLIVATK